jgi:hypothetical protein
MGVAPTITRTVAGEAEWIAETAQAICGQTGDIRVNPERPVGVVADKGYHSKARLRRLSRSGARLHTPKSDRGERSWE